MSQNGADEIKINELEKSLEELETLYNLANNQANALWRTSLMKLILFESKPVKVKLVRQASAFKDVLNFVSFQFGEKVNSGERMFRK